MHADFKIDLNSLIVNLYDTSFLGGIWKIRLEVTRISGDNWFFITTLTKLIITNCRILLNNLPVAQLFKKLIASYGRRSLITMFTTVQYWLQSWARWVQSAASHLIPLRLILLLSFHLSSTLSCILLQFFRRNTALTSSFCHTWQTADPTFFFLLNLNIPKFRWDTNCEAPV